MNALAKRTERFAETEVDDEVVVMRLDNGDFFSLARTAAATWRLIDGTRNRAALVTALTTEFDGDEAEIAADVDEFLVKLREMGLLAVD